MATLQTGKQYFKMSDFVTLVIDTPTTFIHTCGNDAVKTTLVSGEFDQADKAMRGHDENGMLWYIPRRSVLSVEF